MKLVCLLVSMLICCAVASEYFEHGPGGAENYDNNNNDQEDKEGNEDYHLYGLLEKAQAITGQPSLYALFSLPDGAPLDQVSRQFRKLSRAMHPDKQNTNAEGGESENTNKVDIQVLTAAHSALKSEKSRKRLKWLLDEAPPWHRATVYATQRMSRFRQNPKLLFSVKTVLIGCVFASFWVWAWVVIGRFTIEWSIVYFNRMERQKMGRKEAKRLERKEARPSSAPPVKLEYPKFPGLTELFWPTALLMTRNNDNLNNINADKTK